MSVLRSIFATALLASAALATDHQPSGGWGGDSYGGGGWGGEHNTKDVGAEFGGGNLHAAPTCPVGCIPIPTGAPQPPPPGELIVQVVSVADQNGSLKYFPDSIDAPVGSIVQFQFHPKNHTITESTFDEPCKPIADSLKTETRPGVRSGFVPVQPAAEFTPVYNVLINDTKPIWIFCGQTNHCARGMAMVINQNKTSTEKTIQKYIENAAKIPLVNVTAPPPPAGAPPAAPPATATFGGGPPPAASSPVSPVGQASSTVPVAPSIFTGAAAFLNAGNSFVFAGVMGGLFALL